MPLNGTFPYQFKCSKFCLADLGVKVLNVYERESHRPGRLVVLEDPLVTLLLRVALHQSKGVPSHSQAPVESDLSTFLRAVQQSV